MLKQELALPPTSSKSSKAFTALVLPSISFPKSQCRLEYYISHQIIANVISNKKKKDNKRVMAENKKNEFQIQVWVLKMSSMT